VLSDHIHNDAAHKERAYSGLARHYGIEIKDSWLALHAQITADLAAGVIIGATVFYDLDDEGFSTLAKTLDVTLDGKKGDAGRTLKALRKDIMSRLPLEFAEPWVNRLAPLDYLENLPAANPSYIQDCTKLRLAEYNTNDFIQYRYDEADELMDQASENFKIGQEWKAIESAYSSDLSAFEAWLVSKSVLMGDQDLVQTEMRWTLATRALDDIKELPSTFDKALFTVRKRLAWAVGPREAKDFSYSLSRTR
jgi:hypothetical protein